MPPNNRNGNNKPKPPRNNGRGGNNNSGKTKKSEQIKTEIASLAARIQQETPDRGYAPPLEQRVAFRALPLSEPTLRGLEGAKPAPFTTMTAIQNACIPHALAGRDILGAARTGR